MSFQDLEGGRPLPTTRRRGKDEGVTVAGTASGSGSGRRRSSSGSTQSAAASQAVAGGIFQINTSVSSFKRLLNDLGTSRDTPQLREKLHKTRQHIGQLVKETSARLKEASETDQHQEVSASKKVADAKLAKDFQAILKEYQKAQQLAAERETAYTPFVPQVAESSGYSSTVPDLSAEVNQEQQLLIESRKQEFVQLENEVSFNEAIIEERDQGIKEIQNQISEVNEIFKDLAVLVNEQGIVIDDIGSNIETSYAATAEAKTQLVKASKSQKSRKCLSCWVPLAILAVVIIIVVIVLVF